MAILYDDELSDFRVRTFYGSWTVDKRSDILRSIKKAIKRYEITTIVIKAPKATHCSNRILDVLEDVQRLAAQEGISVTNCTITELSRHCSDNETGSKQSLIQTVLKKYPNNRKLAELYEKERNNRNPYYVKVFEAIACAELAKKTER